MDRRTGKLTPLGKPSFSFYQSELSTRERYIEEGVRIALRLGRAPSFTEFNRFTHSVTAWNPYRKYGRDWQAFKSDIEQAMIERYLAARKRDQGRRSGAARRKRPLPIWFVRLSEEANLKKEKYKEN